jgi:hypothetical protein
MARNTGRRPLFTLASSIEPREAIMRRPLRLLALCTAAIAAGSAHASFHAFVIDQMYSNADGSVQYVVLHESLGLDGENLLGGHTLTATSRNGYTHTFTFPANLPGAQTAGQHVLLATRAFPVAATAKLDYVYPPPMDPPGPPAPPDPPMPPPAAASGAPDYVLPDRFLPTEGGTLDYAGVNRVTYGPLPTDGATAMARDGTSVPAVATNFAGVSTALQSTPVTAVEFHDPARDHYFMSALAPDIDALDSARIAGWERTGRTFKVYPADGTAPFPLSPVCRFYIPPEHGNSHFFSAVPAECATVLAHVATDANYSGFVEETDRAFFVALPDLATGACPPGAVPVFRLYDNRADVNHRYTTDPAVKAAMVAAGWIAEGYGNDSVIMCAAP